MSKTNFVEIEEDEIRMIEITDEGVIIQWIDGTFFSATFNDKSKDRLALNIAALYSDEHAKILENLKETESQ